MILNNIKNVLYRVKKSFFPRIIILCYHRIGNYKSDPYELSVTKKKLEKQIKWLKSEYNIIDLDNLVAYYEHSILPPDKSIIITFDDGYSNTIETINLLEKLEVPTTFFMCTPDIKSRYFYWDILQNILFGNIEMKDFEIEFIIKLCRMVDIKIVPEKILTKNMYEKSLQWKLSDQICPTNRCEILKNISEIIEFENPYDAKSILKVLYDNKFYFNENNTNNPQLDSIKLNYCNIGSHSMNHYCLSSLNNTQKEKEIVENKIILENKFNKKIHYFAYPFGKKSHYDNSTIEIVEEHFKLALSNFKGKVHIDSNRYELPRFLIRNWEINYFKKNIRTFFGTK